MLVVATRDVLHLNSIYYKLCQVMPPAGIHFDGVVKAVCHMEI